MYVPRASRSPAHFLLHSVVLSRAAPRRARSESTSRHMRDQGPRTTGKIRVTAARDVSHRGSRPVRAADMSQECSGMRTGRQAPAGRQAGLPGTWSCRLGERSVLLSLIFRGSRWVPNERTSSPRIAAAASPLEGYGQARPGGAPQGIRCDVARGRGDAVAANTIL